MHESDMCVLAASYGSDVRSRRRHFARHSTIEPRNKLRGLLARAFFIFFIFFLRVRPTCGQLGQEKDRWAMSHSRAQ